MSVPTSNWWDMNYQYRLPLTVSASTTDMPSGYTVYSTDDVATLITAGDVRSDGNDWRVLYWDGANWNELDRLVVDWNTSTTKTYFKTQAAISASASDDNYYIYYGYSGETTSPKADGAGVYDFYDDFSVDLTKWTSNGVTLSAGVAEIATTTTGWANYMYSTTSFDRTSIGYLAELEVKVKGTTGNLHEVFIGFGDASTGVAQPREAFYYGVGDIKYFDAANTDIITTDLPGTTLFRKYTIRIDAGSGGFLEADFTTDTYTLTGSDNNMRIKVNPYMGGADVDLVRVRKYVSPEPSTASGTVETQSAPSGRISRYVDLVGLGGQGQMVFNPLT